MPAVDVSLAQMKSLLWSDVEARVHAVIDGARVPGLVQRLVAAELPGWDCLQRGALDASTAANAAYVAELRQASPFTDWLLQEASISLPGWGVLGSSRRSMLDMREHFRSLQVLRLPDGRERAWRWFDPQVLSTLLSVATPDQHRTVMGPLQSLVAPLDDTWACFSLQGPALESVLRRLLPAGR